jgi:hypothetical protein
MDISNAQKEFQIRRYLWAKSKAAEEMKDEFPHFWLFKGGTTWKFYQFVRKLNPNEQQLFVSASLKRSHRYAASGLGETTSIEEKSIEERYFKYALRLTDIERELSARKRAGKTTKFASKRKVRNAMIARFQQAFDGQGLEVVEMKGYESPLLRMKFSGWIVQTNFDFGRTRSLIHYDHLIASEERISNPDAPGWTAPSLVLASVISWIGLTRMEWEYLMDADIEPACDSVITLCREFFDELPKLLKGLERETAA